MEKKLLRKNMMKKAKDLTDDYCKQADEQILKKIQEMPQVNESSMIFCYVGMAHEIDTKKMIVALLGMGKRVCVPKSLRLGIMEAYEMKGIEDLEVGKYDILEPKSGCSYVDPNQIDLALIPCVAADKKGYRLGYGGGFYDRYLSNTRMIKVLLCRELLLVDTIPHESHDVPVDFLITEKEMIAY